MKNTYPIILMPDKVGFVVYVPDLDINTEGDSLSEAMEMSRDAIALYGVTMEDKGNPIPAPSNLSDVQRDNPSAIVTLVDVDFTDYRKKTDTRAVKKNCTIPSWLCYQAEKAGINFSAVLQSGLKRELHITD